jgi:hypothetical protein
LIPFKIRKKKPLRIEEVVLIFFPPPHIIKTEFLKDPRKPTMVGGTQVTEALNAG